MSSSKQELVRSAIVHWAKKYISIIEWLPKYNWKKEFYDDFVAGVTVGVTLISQGMSYALLADLPSVYGLYASLLPAFLYPMFASSRHVTVGPTAVISLLTASAVEPYETVQEKLDAAFILSFYVGVVSMIVGLLKLGETCQNFLPRPCVAGFTAASGCVIVAGQLKTLSGQKIPKSQLIIDNLKWIFGKQYANTFKWETLLTGMLCILVLYLIRKYNSWKKTIIPATLVVTISMIIISYAIRLDGRHVGILGKVPTGLPPTSRPKIGDINNDLFAQAIAISLVGFVETMSVGSKFAIKANYKISGDVEMFAIGVCNFFVSMASGYPVTGSFSRTAEIYNINGNSQMVNFIVGFVIMFACLFLGPLFYYLPSATLAAIVVIAAGSLIDFSEAYALYRYQWRDLLGLIIGFVSTFIWGLEWGVVIAVSYSLVMMVLFSIRPPIAQLGQVGDPEEGRYRPISETVPKYEGYFDRFLWHTRENSDNENKPSQLPNGVIFRTDAPLYFINCSYTLKRLEEYERQVIERGEQCLWVIFDMRSVIDIDSTAIHALVQTVEAHQRNKIWFALADVNDHVAKIINASILIDIVGRQNIFPTIQDALEKRVELNAKENVEQKSESPESTQERLSPRNEIELTSLGSETEKLEEKRESGDKTEKNEDSGLNQTEKNEDSGLNQTEKREAGNVADSSDDGDQQASPHRVVTIHKKSRE